MFHTDRHDTAKSRFSKAPDVLVIWEDLRLVIAAGGRKKGKDFSRDCKSFSVEFVDPCSPVNVFHMPQHWQSPVPGQFFETLTLIGSE